MAWLKLASAGSDHPRMISVSDDRTTYRSWFMSFVIGATGVYSAVMMIFILVFGPPDNVEDGVQVGVGLVLSVWAICRLSRCAVYADDDGIRVLNPVSSTRLRWDEIRRFVLMDDGACRIERVDGSTVKVFGIREPRWGRLRRSRRSQEARMIDELNHRLSDGRAIAA
jgi:hypothetical protein